MPTNDDYYLAREHMVRALESELIGTADDSEITEDPYSRFVTGVLFPRQGGGGASPSTDETPTPEAARLTPDSDDVADKFEVTDTPVALSHVRYPSACGLSFTVPTVTTDLQVQVSAARYHDEDGRWHRDPIDKPVTLSVGAVGEHPTPVVSGLTLRLVVRAPIGGARPLTLALVNELEAPVKGKRDGHAWYQVGFTVSCAEGFLDRPTQPSSGLEDADVRSNQLLFSNVRNLAVGHGCAAAWSDGDVVTAIRTTFLPTHEVHRAETEVKGVELPMSSFEDAVDFDLLENLIARYRRWIDERRDEVAGLEPELRPQAEEHLANAIEAAERMAIGVQLLQRDEVALHAFRLMNRAMHAQRDKQELIRNGKVPANQYWRPFQMAFILLNLPALTDPHSPDRELADLLWFPTGGGKTEAYLGLIGYSILLRRLRNPQHGGVSVLMRYTLRLLTLQQFERATGLICALEMIRRGELPDATPISLGLWVGQAATPNDLASAKKSLTKLAKGEEIQTENPMQLTVCPWCGTELQPKDYRPVLTRLEIRCPSVTCDFHEGIPAVVLDSDVYATRPSLVIATVDKFAMMAWRAEAQTLFSTDGLHPKPDLIVQDELHLISGPLGTMVGLYETAVDAACTDGSIRPKVIASTATIRRATEQVRRVFDRGTRQFPPPGLDITDSFFAVDASKASMGTREYVGVLAQGVTHTYLMVRVYAALLQGAADLDADDAVRDAYWTLMGYFNSLRVLGGAAIQVTDDVPAQMQVIARRHGTELRKPGEPAELTSRIPSSEVPKRLRELAKTYGNDALSVVLATNMISVGLDVDRLGLMAVMGQPQATAEYIQATSRVGRRNPGLVVVIYNSTRSRDLSHYEAFATYHRTLYRQVEPNSATPFSPRARDRGLHGCLVALARMADPTLTPEAAVSVIDAHPERLDAIIDAIMARVRSVAPDEANATLTQLEALVAAWREGAQNGQLKKYAGWRQPAGALLAEVSTTVQADSPAATIFPVGDAPWATLTSLRDVDAVSSLFLVSEKSMS